MTRPTGVCGVFSYALVLLVASGLILRQAAAETQGGPLKAFSQSSDSVHHLFKRYADSSAEQALDSSPAEPESLIKRMSMMRLKKPSMMRLRRGPSPMRLKKMTQMRLKKADGGEGPCDLVPGRCFSQEEAEVARWLREQLALLREDQDLRY